MSRRGLSLVETVVASFVLIAGFLLMTRLFHAALQYTSQIDSLQMAVLLAEKRMEEIRCWSWQTHAATAFSDWSGVPNAATDADYPGYTLAVTTSPYTLSSPCSQFEALYPGEERQMTGSARVVTITVTWGARTHRLTSLVAAPPPVLARVVVTPTAGQSVARDGTVSLTARGEDTANRPIPDMMFSWYIDRGGIGSFIDPQRRDGTQMTFQHRVVLDGVVGYGSGQCQVVAHGRCGPVQIDGRTGFLDLP